MDAIELGEILANLYGSAVRGRLVTKIHLFGIKYSKEILKAGIKEVVEKSGIGASYATEVSKGINLAEWVEITKDISG